MTDIDRMQELINHQFALLRARDAAVAKGTEITMAVYEDEWDAAAEKAIAESTYVGDLRERYATTLRQQIAGAHDIATSIRKMQDKKPT